MREIALEVEKLSAPAPLKDSLGMSAEYDIPRQQRLRRALEAIADAYGFTGELRRERIGEWWLYPNADPL